MLHYKKATLLDIHELVDNLRREDLVEFVLATGEVPRPLPLWEETKGDPTYAILDEQENVCAVFGSVPDPLDTDTRAILWFLATDRIEDHSLSLLKTFPEYLYRICEGYNTATAWMWEGNAMHGRWAQALGLNPTGETLTINHSTFIQIGI